MLAKLRKNWRNLARTRLIEWLSQPTPPVPQPHAGATYAKKVDKAEARMDWTQPAEQVDRQVRAFAPSPGAWFEVKGERIKLLEAAVGDDASGQPGEVLDDCLMHRLRRRATSARSRSSAPGAAK